MLLTFNLEPFAMRKALFLLLCFLVTAIISVAQQTFLQGYLKDSLTQLPIAGGTLSNTTKKQKILTNHNGFFRLLVSPRDLIYALATHYQYDTLRYSPLFQDTVTIFLVPDDLMQAVIVETGYQRYQQDSLRRRASFEQDAGPRMSTIDRSPKKTFGLVINLDRLFKRKNRSRAMQEQVFVKQEQQAYINFRFSPGLVSFYTGLKGDGLVRFMQLYSPSYEWLRGHPYREEVIDYISSKLQVYRKNNTENR